MMEKDLKEIPNLKIKRWHWVAKDGFPEDEYVWCLLMWKTSRGKMEVSVGSYFAERKEFYVNFGLGGAVLSAESIVGWAAFEDCEWEMPCVIPTI